MSRLGMRLWTALSIGLACAAHGEPPPSADPVPLTVSLPRRAYPELPKALLAERPKLVNLEQLKARYPKLPERLLLDVLGILAMPNLDPASGGRRATFLVPKGLYNLAQAKKVTASAPHLLLGELSMVTDEDSEAGPGSYVELPPGPQWVQVDLGGPCEIFAVALWHWHAQPRVYRDVIVEVSDTADFSKNVNRVFNSDYDNHAGRGPGSDLLYIETFEGRLFDVKGAVGRYVRCYSNGNSANDMNHVTEVEVYGRPAK